VAVKHRQDSRAPPGRARRHHPQVSRPSASTPCGTARPSIGLSPVCRSRRSPILLGHSSIAITGDVYGHTSDDTARAAVDGLAGRLGL